MTALAAPSPWLLLLESHGVCFTTCLEEIGMFVCSFVCFGCRAQALNAVQSIEVATMYRCRIGVAPCAALSCLGLAHTVMGAPCHADMAVAKRRHLGVSSALRGVLLLTPVWVVISRMLLSFSALCGVLLFTPAWFVISCLSLSFSVLRLSGLRALLSAAM